MGGLFVKLPTAPLVPGRGGGMYDTVKHEVEADDLATALTPGSSYGLIS